MTSRLCWCAALLLLTVARGSAQEPEPTVQFLDWGDRPLQRLVSGGAYDVLINPMVHQADQITAGDADEECPIIEQGRVGGGTRIRFILSENIVGSGVTIRLAEGKIIKSNISIVKGVAPHAAIEALSVAGGGPELALEVTLRETASVGSLAISLEGQTVWHGGIAAMATSVVVRVGPFGKPWPMGTYVLRIRLPRLDAALPGPA